MKITRDGKMQWVIVFYTLSLVSTWAHSYLNTLRLIGGTPHPSEPMFAIVILVATALAGGLAFFTEES